MHTKLLQLCHQSNLSLQKVISFTRAHARAGRMRLRVYVPLVSGVLILVVVSGVAQAVTQGYKTNDSSIGKAMAVALADSQVTDEGASVYVEKSTTQKADRTLGIVVSPNEDLVTVSTSGDQVYVANSGLVQVYVTDINGEIKIGDLLAPSPIGGVLMRSNEGSKGVLGAAQDNFPATGVQATSVKNENGQTITANLAQIRINMDVKFSTSNTTSGKSLLQRIGESIVRRPVNTTQVIVAMVILAVLLLVEGSIIYGAISSSIISLGRNPLAKRTIMKGLGQITILVFIVLAIGLAATYLVLWI